MLDVYSRKILKYIKRKKQASFKELLKLGADESFMAQTISELNVNGFTIQVGTGEGQALYELQSKGYAALEEHTNYIFIHMDPIVISIIALGISVLALFKP